MSRLGVTGRPVLAPAVIALAGAVLIAACGTQPSRGTASGPAPLTAPLTAPLSTSLVTGQGTWAVAVMGGATGEGSGFWQLFVRAAGAAAGRWLPRRAWPTTAAWSRRAAAPP